MSETKQKLSFDKITTCKQAKELQDNMLLNLKAIGTMYPELLDFFDDDDLDAGLKHIDFLLSALSGLKEMVQHAEKNTVSFYNVDEYPKQVINPLSFLPHPER